MTPSFLTSSLKGRIVKYPFSQEYLSTTIKGSLVGRLQSCAKQNRSIFVCWHKAQSKGSGSNWLGNGLLLFSYLVTDGCNIFIIKPFMAFFCIVTIARVKLPDKLNLPFFLIVPKSRVLLFIIFHQSCTLIEWQARHHFLSGSLLLFDHQRVYLNNKHPCIFALVMHLNVILII